MNKYKLKNRDLKQFNLRNNKARSLVIDLMQKHYKHLPIDKKLELLAKVIENPKNYSNDEVFSDLANELIGPVKLKHIQNIELMEESSMYNIFGKQHISLNAIKQMDTVMSLPISEKGALMPDAHHGYGLPIGGVLATTSTIIPYGVGVDIGCSMSLSIFELPVNYLKRYSYQVKMALEEFTHFGMKTKPNFSFEHEVVEQTLFSEIPLLKNLQGKARMQLGSSGSGNHFVEFGTISLHDNNNLGLKAGDYIGLLSHSGSRGLGAEIANHYTQIAIEKCPLPKGAKHLAWLDLSSAEGQEYWKCMHLAGDYAKANHECIHKQLSKALKIKPVKNIYNWHNFAWQEEYDGEKFIVHRKGATPAGQGVLGIIPGSMASPAYIVSGKGNVMSLNSASHGAGRHITRSKAKQSITRSKMRKYLKQKGVELLSASVDESPFVYKDIDEIMLAQQNLVKTEGVFMPKIVKMNDE